MLGFAITPLCSIVEFVSEDEIYGNERDERENVDGQRLDREVIL